MDITTLGIITEMSKPSVIISDEYKLLSINHNLNSYPLARVLGVKYGAGVGGAGDNPAGDVTYDLERKIAYENENIMTIYTSKEYIGNNPVVQKISDTKYIVTYDDSVISIILNLIN